MESTRRRYAQPRLDAVISGGHEMLAMHRLTAAIAVARSPGRAPALKLTIDTARDGRRRRVGPSFHQPPPNLRTFRILSRRVCRVVED
jgi:hypothetical protein